MSSEVSASILDVRRYPPSSAVVWGPGPITPAVRALIIANVGVFVVTLRDSASPDYGSGASIGGVGLVLILGLGLIVIGIVFMMMMRTRQPEFFRGETLHKDTPVVVVDEP